MRQGMKAGRGLRRISDRIDRHAAPANPGDRAQQLRREARYRHHDLRRPRLDQQPRLIFDHRHSGERQGGGEGAGAVLGILNGKNQPGEHRVLLESVPRTGNGTAPYLYAAAYNRAIA